MRRDLAVFSHSLFLAGALAMPQTSLAANNKLIAGWIEPLQVMPAGVVMMGKLDTGATTSSLHCKCSAPEDRGGKKWVRFEVSGKDGKVATLEREVVRKVKIKRHFGGQQERLVVKVGLCLANLYKEVEVTLVDRTGFEYPLLVGRNFLEGDVLVDSAVKGSTSPNCKAPASP
jgi:hypothetical protein